MLRDRALDFMPVEEPIGRQFGNIARHSVREPSSQAGEHCCQQQR